MRTTLFPKLLAILLAVMAVAGGPAAVLAQDGQVTPPPNARTVACAPAEAVSCYAATAGILLHSSDGVTWQEAGQLPGVVRSLAVTAGESPALVAGTASNGIYRSFDGGASWQAVNLGVGLAPGTVLVVNALAADPADARIVYAATGYYLGTSAVHFTPARLLVSVDGGGSWLTLARLPLNSPRFDNLEAVAGHPLTVAASSGDGAMVLYSATADSLTATLDAPEAAAVQRLAATRALGLAGELEATPALIQVLKQGDATLAAEAAAALGNLRATAAIPALTRMLESPQPAAPSMAARALAAIGTPDALSPLYAALQTEEMTPARHGAMAALEALGAPATPGLTALAASSSVIAQRNAVEVLGWIADPAALDTLTAAVQASDPGVRAMAAWALGETLALTPVDTAQVALAHAAFNDPSPDVRMQATQALTRLPQAPVSIAATEGASSEIVAAGPAQYTIVEGTVLTLPGWLTTAMPALRWLILGLALAAIAALPWLQNARDHRRRRRHN